MYPNFLIQQYVFPLCDVYWNTKYMYTILPSISQILLRNLQITTFTHAHKFENENMWQSQGFNSIVIHVVYAKKVYKSKMWQKKNRYLFQYHIESKYSSPFHQKSIYIVYNIRSTLCWEPAIQSHAPLHLYNYTAYMIKSFFG